MKKAGLGSLLDSSLESNKTPRLLATSLTYIDRLPRLLQISWRELDNKMIAGVNPYQSIGYPVFNLIKAVNESDNTYFRCNWYI